MAKEALKKQIDKSTKTEFDSVIFYTTMTLVFIGIIMVFSASFVQSAFKHNDSYYFLKRNAIYATLGFISMIIISNIDYRFWKKNAKAIGIVSVILLLLVLTPLGIKANGAKTLVRIWSIYYTTSRNCKVCYHYNHSKVYRKKI